MQIKDVTKRRDDEVVIHYIDDAGEYQSLRAYPSDIIAWYHAAQHRVHPTNGGLCAVCGKSADHHEDHDYVAPLTTISGTR